MTLKVLHVNAADLDGGAARAAFRINLALRKQGVDSRMLVLHRREAHAAVLQPQSSRTRVLQKVKAVLAHRLTQSQRTSNPVLHSLNYFSSGLADWINRSDADIVNLHWLGGEMISIEEIGRIKKPICWTMHDMWPFSGAEHYDDLQSPERYQHGYHATSRPTEYSGVDLDAWVWRRKRKAWSGKTFHLISPSRWLADCAGKSALFAHQPRTVIPNCIDLGRFYPIDRRQARAILGLREDRRYILFGAMSSTSDQRKGFHLLQPALKRLAEQPEIAADTELLVFGASTPLTPPEFGLPAHYMGHLYDEVSLALLYSAADVFAAPSMQDNLPNTLVESLACGTPCVAFNLGGMPDLIIHQSTGYLAPAYDSIQFAEGLVHILQQPRDTIRTSCRTHAESNYSENTVATRYLALYCKILENKP